MKSTQITRSFLVLLLSLLTLTVTATPVGAQTAPTSSYAFTVTTAADTHDVNRGDGVCADQKGQCSLRAATEEADALPAGSSIMITVPAGTYKLRLGALFLTAQRSITITGAGNTTTIIKGNYSFRVLYIASPTMSASLSQLTIEGGSAPNTGYGGGIDNGGTLSVNNCTIRDNLAPGSGGGIFNHGTLSVSSSTFSNNTANGRGYGGGAIFNSGTLSVSSSTFSNNTAPNGNGNGGGIFNRGTVSVSSSTFSGNSASAGGGIYNRGRMSVSSSTFSNNSTNDGGGIINGIGATLSVSSSTFSGNTAVYGGGGIENDLNGRVSVSSSTFSGNLTPRGAGGGIYNQGRMSVSSSTFSGNRATQGDGGGIYNSSGTLIVENSTINLNSALNGGGIDNDGSTVTLTGTIMANLPNCAGTITEGIGYNLDIGTSCGFSLSTDLTNTDPMLGPLKNNGGPTQTMALLQGSKAIDWVAASSCPTTDQRGYVRPDGSGESTCDIGAYESAY